VAVLEGYTTAGGFEIMVNCDFAIAADDAQLGDFHIRRALFGGAGPLYRLPRLVGLRKAKELMLTGKLMTGIEAKEFGLITDSAPADQLDDCVDAFVGLLADKSPYAMAITKLVVNRGLDGDTETLMALEQVAGGPGARVRRCARGHRRIPREARPEAVVRNVRVHDDFRFQCGRTR